MSVEEPVRLREVKGRGPFPSIFYIGQGKVASSSVLYGFPDYRVAHWHDACYFKGLHGPDSLVDYQDDLYDFVFNNCRTHNIKPLIIEHVRDPVARIISHLFQVNKLLTYNKAMELLHQKNFTNQFQPYSLNLIPTYINHLKKYQENDHGKFVILKFESELKDRKSFFKNIGYNFIDNHPNNKSNNQIYKKVTTNFKLDEDQLLKIYNEKSLRLFYNEKEIKNFIKKWQRKV
jgi:hypothetical protein